MALIQQLALVSQVPELSLDKVTKVSAALQKQISRDFGPIWSVKATIDSFGKLADVPVGYWPIVIKKKIPFKGAAGIHLDQNGQPFALVQFSSDWALTTSHEVLEMLADPFGNRLMAGKSPKAGQGRVEFLVEVCDPSEDGQFGYTVNDILLSDFYTPHYFDPKTAHGVRYSFTGAITKPREVLEGGYLSWHDPKTDHWFQLTEFGTKEFHDLGVQKRQSGESLRAMIDRLTTPKHEEFLEKTAATRAVSFTAAAASTEESSAWAGRLQSEIDQFAE